MQKYKSNVISSTGAAIRATPVSVFKEDGSLASIFLDREGIIPASNPIITDASGTFYFYAVNGRYSLQTTVDGAVITDDDVVLLYDPDEAKSHLSSDSLGYVNVILEGVDNTGKTDIRKPLQDLIYKVGKAGGGKIVFPPGVYKIMPSPNYGYGVCIQHDNIHLHLEAGAVIELSDPNRLMLARDFSQTGTFHVGGAIEGIDSETTLRDNSWSYQGYNVWRDPNRTSYVMPPKLVQSATLGDRKLIVDSVGQIKAGNWVYLRSTEFEENANYGQQTLRTEIALVESVNAASGTIALSTDILSTYNIANFTVSVIPLRIINNFALTGLGEMRGAEFISLEHLPLNGKGETGIYLSACNNASVTDVVFKDFENTCINAALCTNFSVSRTKFLGYRLPDNYVGTGTGVDTYGGYYGLSVTGCQYVNADDIYGQNIRHTIDTGVGSSMTRELIASNIKVQSSYASGLSTHGAVDVIYSNCLIKDSMGGCVVRGKNFIGSNLDLEGNTHTDNPVGGFQIGVWTGGDDGKGDPLAVTHDYGIIQLSNSRIRNTPQPISLFGATEAFMLSNLQVESTGGDTKDAIFVFARKIKRFQLRDCIIDCTGQNENDYIGAISIREWSATVAEQGTIDIQGCTFINPSSYVMSFFGVATDENVLAGNYIIKNNKFIFDGRKSFKPWALIRFSGGYFNNIDVSGNEVIGYPRYETGFVTFDMPISNVKGLINIQNNTSNLNGTGKSIENNSLLNFGSNIVNFPIGTSVRSSAPTLGVSTEYVATSSGTKGNLDITVYGAKGTNTLTIVGAYPSTLRAGQFLSVPDGSEPLVTVIERVISNVITIHDVLGNDIGNVNSPVSITYAAPRLAPMPPNGIFLSGEGSPFGLEKAPTGAIYIDRNITNGVLAWVQRKWEDKTAWQPLFSSTQLKSAAATYATSISASVQVDMQGSVFNKQVVYDLYSSLPDFVTNSASDVLIPFTNFEKGCVSVQHDLSLLNYEYSRNSERYSFNAGKLYKVGKNIPSFKYAFNTVDVTENENFPRTTTNSKGFIFNGAVSNLIDAAELGLNWHAYGCTLVSSDVLNPSGDSALGKFKILTETTESTSERSITYTYTPSGLTLDSVAFSVFVYAPATVPDRALQINFQVNGGWTTVNYNFSTKNVTGTGSGDIRIEDLGNSIYRISSKNFPSSSTISSLSVSIKQTLLDGTTNFSGDTTKQYFYLWGAQLSQGRDNVEYTLPGVQANPDMLSITDFDLSKEALVSRITPNFSGSEYRILKIGDHEIWMTANYRGEWWNLSYGMYYKDVKNNVTTTLINTSRGNTKLIPGERISLGFDGTTVRIYAEGVLRMEYAPATVMNNVGLIVGGSNLQNFVVDSIIRLPDIHSGYELKAASTSI